MNYKRLKEESNENNKYILEIKGVTIPNYFSINIQIKTRPLPILTQITDLSSVQLDDEHIVFLKSSTIKNTKIEEEGIMALHATQDSTDKMILYSKEVSITKKDQNDFPFTQISPRQYNLYFSKSLLEDTENENYLIIFFKKIKAANYLFSFSDQIDMILLSQVSYQSITLIQNKPLLLNIKDTKGKKLFISSPHKSNIYIMANLL